MMLVDAGPLIAIIDGKEPDHRACVAVLEQLSGPLLTTWPVFTEAMHLLQRHGGWAAQEKLWRVVGRGDVAMLPLDQEAIKSAQQLMYKYRDLPMDLADATLVAVAEQMKVTRVFTLDSDFHLYRIRGRRSFQIVP